jgi:hypothetical protein
MSVHQRFQMLAAQALDFDSSPTERDELAAHFAVCGECRRFETGLRADERLVRSRPRSHAPDRIRVRVLSAADRPVAPSQMNRILPVVGAAVVALALLAGFGWLNSQRIAAPPQLPVRLWTRIGDVPAFGNGWVSSAVGTGAQLIAAGTTTAGGQPHAAAWISPDGLSWVKLPDDASFTNASAGLVAVHADTMVIAGARTGAPSGPGVGTPTIWLTQGLRSCDTCSSSPSGDPWRLAATSFPRSGETAIGYSGLVAGGPGFVLAGSEFSQPGAGDIPVGAAVATSVDGSTWTMGQSTSPEFAGGSMRDVAAGPSGLAAVGETALDPTIWTSADGLTWTRLVLSVPAKSASLRSIAGGPTTFVVVGDDGGSAMSWISADGRAWQAASKSPALADARMQRVFWLGAEFVAIGESSSGDAVGWSSADGLSWTRFETGSIFSQAHLQTAAAIGSRYLLFGVDASDRVVVGVGENPGQR